MTEPSTASHLGPPVTAIFVYGTLMPGRFRWAFLEPFAVGHRPAEVTGRLFDSGRGWPIAQFAEGAGTIPGVLVELDREAVFDALTILDDVEDTVTKLLRRITVRTTTGETAWAYHCDDPPPTATPIAAWWDQPES